MAKEQWDSREGVAGDLRRADCSCFLNAGVGRCFVARKDCGRILFSLGSFHIFGFAIMNFGGSPVAEKNPYRQFVNKEGPENSEGCPGPSSCDGACYFRRGELLHLCYIS